MSAVPAIPGFDMKAWRDEDEVLHVTVEAEGEQAEAFRHVLLGLAALPEMTELILLAGITKAGTV